MQEKILDAVVNFLWDVPLVFAILFTGFFYTIESKFFQLTHLKLFFRETICRIWRKGDEPRSPGMLTPLEAAYTAIGSTVGIGSIGGVATAIAIGGPGAVFWMWIAAFIGMIIKTAEVTLSVHYRTVDEEGNLYGGPTFYIENGIGKEMNVKAWILPASLFGVGIISTVFISIINYAASDAISSTFGVNIFAVSIVYALLLYFLIMNGIKYLGKIFTIMIPVTTTFYIVLGLVIIGMNAEKVWPVLVMIGKDAFLGTAAVGGFAGAALSQVITMGVSQAVYSSEFGWGTSPMIHSTAKVNHPVKQGFWGGIEVFVNTIVICSITAFVILLSGEWTSGESGMTLALKSYESILGPAGKYMVTVVIFFFAITTSSAWYSYTEIILRHLFRKQTALKNKLLKLLKLVYPLPEFLLVIYVVIYHISDRNVWLMTEITTAVPTFVNIFVLLILSQRFKKLLQDYKARHMGRGVVDEDFSPFHSDQHGKKAD
ncbi:UNVERIFIED_CONTAM: AGCS family alanine or glycine:cation symporter [Brevibacillus sp. OAP136]